MAQLDINSASQVLADAEEVFLTPKAEQTLTSLLELKKKLESYIKDIDTKIDQAKLSAQSILDSINQSEVT